MPSAVVDLGVDPFDSPGIGASPDALEVRPEDEVAVQRVERWFRDYAQSRDPVLRERIILAYLGLADRLAERYRSNRAVSLEDLRQVARLGLVKAVDGKETPTLTSANAVTGTPLYISPEAVKRPDLVDARADVYAIGAVGYFLLTGSPVFTGASVMEICLKHMRAVPEPPSDRIGRPISPDLEALLLRCLAKARSDRPADAGDLLHRLEGCAVEGRWTADDAASWWAEQVRVPAPKC